MKFYSYYSLILLLIISFSACKKDKIAPENQYTTFIKTYGHVAEQNAVDLKIIEGEEEGGYLALGSSSSYSLKDHTGIFLVKADSNGNEKWSYLFKKQDAEGQAYNEEAAKVLILPNQEGYLVVGNRDYIDILDGVENLAKTKIVLYKVDIEGGLIGNPVVLDEETVYSDWVNDIVYDSLRNEFVLIGKTTNINAKGGGSVLTGVDDKLDIYVVRLLADLSIDPTFNQAKTGYGFGGEDIGYSVHIASDGRYIFSATIDVEVTSSGTSFIRKKVYAIVSSSNTFTGFFAAPTFFESTALNYSNAYSTYNPVTEKLTFLGNYNNPATPDEAKELFIMQSTYNAGLITTPLLKEYNATNFSAYKNTKGWNLEAASITSIQDGGFVLSATNQSSILDTEVAIFKIDQDLNVDEAWPVYLGYQYNGSGQEGTLDKAAIALPIYSNVAGTSQDVLSGFVTLSTFGMGTNSMMGLVKLDVDGELSLN